MALIDIKHATLYIRDGSTPTNEIEVKIGEGNLNFSEKINLEYILNRGKLDYVAQGDEVPVDVSFDFVWEYITSPSGSPVVPTPIDALKQRGPAAAWVSTTADQCQRFSVDLVLHYKPACSIGDQEVIILPDFRYEDLGFDLRGRAIACSGKCNVTEATVTRYLASSSVNI